MKYLGTKTDPKDVATQDDLSSGGGGGSPLLAWPVGSIFMSTVSTNPSTLLGGGTWAAWGTGRVPVAVDTTQTEFNTVEKTGGEKTHILTAAEMPSHTHTDPSHSHDMSHDHPNAVTDAQGNHNHTIFIEWGNNTTASGSAVRITDIMNLTGGSGSNAEAPTRDAGNHAHNFDVPYYGGSTGAAGGGQTGSAGSDGAHNNLQPYITCYMWKRTA